MIPTSDVMAINITSNVSSDVVGTNIVLFEPALFVILFDSDIATFGAASFTCTFFIIHLDASIPRLLAIDVIVLLWLIVLEIFVADVAENAPYVNIPISKLIEMEEDASYMTRQEFMDKHGETVIEMYDELQLKWRYDYAEPQEPEDVG